MSLPTKEEIEVMASAFAESKQNLLAFASSCDGVIKGLVDLNENLLEGIREMRAEIDRITAEATKP